METAKQRPFYSASFLQILKAAFCLLAVPAERSRGKEQDQIGYKLSGMFVERPFLSTEPGMKSGRVCLLGNELWHHFVLTHTVKWQGESVAGQAGKQKGCFKWRGVPQTGISL